MSKLVTMVAFSIESGLPVTAGDTVTSFRGEPATLIMPSQPTIPGKSGKVVVEWADRSGSRDEYYANVFGLRVSGLMDCGCPVGPDNPDHLDGCDAE